MTWRVRRRHDSQYYSSVDVDPHPTRVGQLILAGRNSPRNIALRTSDSFAPPIGIGAR